MGLGRYVVDALVLEGRSPSELARSHHILRSWIYELVARYRARGNAALVPLSRLLRSCRHQAFPRVKAGDGGEAFAAAAGRYGLPAAVLTDNGAVFSGSSRGGTVLWESECVRLGIRAVHSTPYHPQTCGKVERFHQTVKRYLKKQAPARSIAHLQAQLDGFRAYYNLHRPHRALDRRTPLVAFNARVKAKPALPEPTTDFRVRHDKVDSCGRVTLRYLSVLRHIYIGRAHKGQAIRLLVAGDHVRIVREDGQVLRALTLDSDRRYFGAATPVHNVVRQVSSMS